MANFIDFGELSRDENLKTKVLNFKEDLEKVEKTLETLCSHYKYDDLSLEDKVRYDLFLAFSIDSLYWMYLRTKGIDPNQHDIKSQINRVREYMNKSKELYEKKTIMPRINKDAAKRFVRSGLWTKNSDGNEVNTSQELSQDKD